MGLEIVRQQHLKEVLLMDSKGMELPATTIVLHSGHLTSPETHWTLVVSFRSLRI